MSYSISLAALDLTPQRRSVFQNATTQKERAGGRRLAGPAERQFDPSRLRDDDWISESLLDLSGKKQSHCAVVMLIIGVVMDELVHAGTDREHGSPLEHRSQEQGNNCCARRGIGNLSGHRLSGFPFSNHENA